MNYKTKLVYTYKDANRYWWTLTLERGRCDDRNTSCLEDPDHFWSYALQREDDELNWKGEVWGQYDMPPTVADVMHDIASQMIHIGLGFTEHGTEIKTA